jgi:hypothetical protein
LIPAFGELENYESNAFYPTIPTTYDYRKFGDINGINLDVKFSCTPAGGEVAPSDNSTIEILKMIRKALIGGFECPSERMGFPEPYVSQYEVSQELNRPPINFLENRVIYLKWHFIILSCTDIINPWKG